MTKIFIREGGILCEATILFKIPFMNRYVAWVHGWYIIEAVEKFFDKEGYFFNRAGRNYRELNNKQ